MCRLGWAPGGPQTMIEPVFAPGFGWQSEHLRKSKGATFPGAGVLGGAPWQDPQKACETPSVHTGFRSLKLVSAASDWPPPWQYDVQVAVVRSQVAAAPSVTASPLNVTSAGSEVSRWPGLSMA